MPLKREDTKKVLQLMQACQSVGDETFQVQSEKLLRILQNDLFQALLDIQEYYELAMFENREIGSPLTPVLFLNLEPEELFKRNI